MVARHYRDLLVKIVKDHLLSLDQDRTRTVKALTKDMQRLNEEVNFYTEGQSQGRQANPNTGLTSNCMSGPLSSFNMLIAYILLFFFCSRLAV